MRQYLINTWNSGGYAQDLELRLRKHGLSKDETDIGRIARIHQENLRRAVMYWVSPDMCTLLDSCRDSVPLDITLTAELIPAENSRGVVFFARTLEGFESYGDHIGERIINVDVINWYPTVRTDTVSHRAYMEFRIDSYTHLKHPIIKFQSLGCSEWSLNRRIDEWSDAVPCDNKSVIEDRQLLMAFFSLLASPGVTETHHLTPSPNKSARRREGDVSAVRLIYLRGSETQDHHGDSPREYHHRWVVTGHWRSQPYGPGRSLRRATWIRPHVKGPADAPLLTGEKVHVLS